MKRAGLVALVVATVAVPALEAQQAAPARDQLVAVFITGNSCCSQVVEMMKPGLERLRTQLRRQADGEGVRLRVIGVAFDGSTGALPPYGAFDEVSIAGAAAWHTPLLDEIMWSDSIAVQSIPQIVVYRQSAAGQRRLIRRYVGVEEIGNAGVDNGPGR